MWTSPYLSNQIARKYKIVNMCRVSMEYNNQFEFYLPIMLYTGENRESRLFGISATQAVEGKLYNLEKKPPRIHIV